MAKQYDATIKTLVEAFPLDWLKYAGLPLGDSVEVIDADVSSITAAADKVLRVNGIEPYVGHIEFQSSLDLDADRRTMFYNVVLGWRHRLPVRSVVLLLRPQADHQRVKGEYIEDHGVAGLLHFRYRVIRLWEQSPERLLAGGLGTLPLAPISNVKDAEFPAVFEQVWRRLQKEVPRPQAIEEITATAILAGLRHPDNLIEQLMAGVAQMEESTVYQAILRKGLTRGREEGREEGRQEGREVGRTEEAREILMRMAARRFGPPPAPILSRLESLPAVRQIEELIERVSSAKSWDDLLNQN